MVTYQYAPAVDGGAERQAQRLAEELAARGRRVGVVTARYPGLPRYERLGGVEVHRVWAIPKPRRMSLTFLPSLATFLLTGGRRFDIWHAHQAYYNAGVALRIADLVGRPCVVKAAASGPYGDLARLDRSPMGGWVRKALLRADVIISLNSELREELAAVGIDLGRVRHIPNGVDCERFSPPSQEERREARARFGIPRNGALVVFAGRLAEDKGIGYLLEAWSGIERRFPDAAWTLIVAGEALKPGQDRRPRQGGLRTARFVGKVPDVRPLLHAADLLVHPSLTEGLSNVVLEAMACGVPVVGTAIGGLNEQIDHGVTGLLVAPRSAEALVQGVTSLLDDPELRASMGGAARNSAVNRYGLTKVVDSYEGLYDELVEGPVR